MKKNNITVCGIAFALPVIYFSVQAFLDRKYLFLIAAAAGMAFWIRQTCKDQNPASEIKQINWIEKETDLCVALGILLWTSYVCVYDFVQIELVISGYNSFLWIPGWLLVCRLLDRIKNTVVTIHLKTAAGWLFAVFAGKILMYQMPTLLIFTFLGILGITYLIAMKRYLCRQPEENTGLRFVSLYRATAVILVSFTLLAGFRPDLLSAVFYDPLSVIRIHWTVFLAITAAAVMLMINAENRTGRCLAGEILLVVLYCLAFQEGVVNSFSVPGILCGCLLAGWIAEILDRQRIFKGAAGIPVFFLLSVPGVCLIEESIVKGKYSILLLAVLGMLLIKRAVDGTDPAKTRSVVQVIVILPYFMLIFAYGSKTNRNLFLTLVLAGITVAVLSVFMKITCQEEKIRHHAGKAASAAGIVIIAFLTFLPLASAAVNVWTDPMYPEYVLRSDTVEFSIGTEMVVVMNGFPQNTEVQLDWGNGQKEKQQGNAEISTAIKSSHLKITATDQDGEKRIYHRFFPVWNMNQE